MSTGMIMPGIPPRSPRANPFCAGPQGNRRLARTAVLLLAVLLPVPAARAGGGPENVALVVNADSWASQTVANAFIDLRHIPAGNVIYLRDLPSFEHAGVGEFRARVLGPVLEAIRNRGLQDQIDYIVYSADLPRTVAFNDDTKGRELPRMITGSASATGLTYCQRLVMAKDPEYLDLGVNFYVRRPVLGRRAPMRPPTEAEQAAGAQIARLLTQEQWAEAEAAIRRLLKDREDSPDLRYNLACCLARQDRPDEAMAELARAVADGWWQPDHTLQDEDLAPLRGREDFQRLIERMKNPVFDLQPTLGFRSSEGWARDGRRVAGPDGRQYMLSTMLAVTSGRGNSVGEALAYLRASAAADGTAPKGTVYLMRNKDVRSTTRDWAFVTTAAKLKELGVAAEILDGVLPPRKPDVAGAVIGSGAFDWAGCGSTILPGAICEHLTSYGGALGPGTGQTPLTDFLRYGAAGSSGTVSEPMAIQAKFPLAFIHVHYAKGCTLAEAFYQSVAGPYQLLVVGDPLCRPWAKIPTVTVEGVKAGATVKGALALRPAADARGGAPPDRFELLVDGRRRATCAPGGTLDLDTRALSDGRHDLRVVAVAGDDIATQGRAILPVTVANRGRALRVQAPPAEKPVPWDRPLRVEASLQGAKVIRFLHHGRVLGSIEGEGGAAELPLDEVGLGPVAIAVVGYLSAEAVGAADPKPEEVVLGEPLRLEVGPPAALGPVEPPAGAAWAKGLLLVPNGGQPRTLDKMLGGWGKDAGLAEKQSYTLEGYCDVPAEDVYQFQLRSGGELAVEVDGRPVARAAADRWRMVPVPLAAGTHRVVVKGTYAGLPEVRFGGPGAASLSSDRFRHVAPPPAPAPPAAPSSVTP